jgi:hypothetical protein
MKETQRLIDLCCCVNALDSYFCTDESGGFTEHSQRQRNVLTDIVLEEAQKLRDAGSSLTDIDAAFHEGGWEDNRAQVGVDGKLKIVYV